MRNSILLRGTEPRAAGGVLAAAAALLQESAARRRCQHCARANAAGQPAPTSLGITNSPNSHHLQVLHLDHNELDCLPPPIFHMPHLRVLTLSHNRLTSTCIPEVIDDGCGAVQLQAVVLDHNVLGRIAAGIGAFKQLQVRINSQSITLASSSSSRPPTHVRAAAAPQLRTQRHPRSASGNCALPSADGGQYGLQCVRDLA